MPEIAPNAAATRERRPTPRWRGVPWSVVVFVAGAVPLVLVGLRRGRGQFDEGVFHLPTIRRFAWQMGPGRGGVDLADYLSATTPGYHLLLAAVARWVGDGVVVLKLVSLLFTVGLLWVLEGHVRRRIGERAAPGVSSSPSPCPLHLVAPVVGSMYVFVPGVWLQPDNAGWLGVLVMMLIALRPRWDAWSLVAGGMVMLVLVWMRQAHVWAAGVLWVAAWIGGAARAAPGAGGEPSIAYSLGTSVAWMVRPSRERLVRLVLAVLVTLPALVSLAWFARMWGGLTPPAFREQHGGGWNPATPAFAMALVAIYSCFFGAWVWPGLSRLWHERRRGGWLVIVPCVLVGVLAAAIPVTTFLYEPRSTGLWNIVKAMDERKLSINMRTSPLLLVLAPVGMVAAAAWLVQLPRRRAWVYGLAMLGFLAAQTANTNAWQRYLEPFFLMMMALMAADLWARPTPPHPQLETPPWWVGGERGRWVGPAVLGVLGAMLTAVTLWREPVFVKDWPDHPLARPDAVRTPKP